MQPTSFREGKGAPWFYKAGKQIASHKRQVKQSQNRLRTCFVKKASGHCGGKDPLCLPFLSEGFWILQKENEEVRRLSVLSGQVPNGQYCVMVSLEYKCALYPGASATCWYATESFWPGCCLQYSLWKCRPTSFRKPAHTERLQGHFVSYANSQYKHVRLHLI